MSAQSIFAFVFLSAFAISAPTQAAVINSNAVSQSALCAGLAYSAPGVNSVYDACVAAKLVATTNTITERGNVEIGLTAAICTGLNLKVIGVSALYDACVSAGLLVATNNVNTKNNAITHNTSAHLYADAFLNAMNGCNSLSTQLQSVVAGVAKLTASVVASLSADVIIPTLVKVSASLNAAIAATVNLTACTDAAVEANVLQRYNVFAASLNSLLASLSTSLTLYSTVEVKTSLHSTLTGLRATLVAYTNQLDRYLSADLAKSSIKATLLVTLDAALNATTR